MRRLNPKAAKTVRVIDGDTLVLLIDKKEHTIHLVGIDAPELKQRYGKEATKALSDRIIGEKVHVEPVGEDRYKRTLGFVGGSSRLLEPGSIHFESLSVWLVENGHAWQDVKYDKDNEMLAAAEKEAREAKRGLWAAQNPVPPWEWRKKRAKETKPEKKASN